ncbi:MAG: zinc metalloprotease HtpX [Planctomycetes bacterium]|nr:zinc metalloprotease HtpX [Planctomycetota bacterium]
MQRFMNNLKTAIFLGALFGIVLLIGSAWGTRGLTIAFIAGGMMNVVAYFFSDKIALASMRGQEVDEKTAPDLVPMVARLAKNAGLPMPRVYVCPQEAPNAFATGRNPRHAAVAVTRGALQLLSFDELEGVLGHELAHVKHRDTLISCVAATIAGAISYMGYMAMWMGGGGNNRDSGVNPIVAILMLILAPIAAGLIQAAISRSREFEADAEGAQIAGTPHGLINALLKLDATARRIPLENEMPSQNHMFIVMPLSARGMANLFSTHPPTAQRVARLRALA